MNQMALDDKDRLSIFDKNGPYLATKKIGKNNPKAAKIKADNEIRMEWNRAVDRAVVSGVPEAAILLLERLITKVMQKVMDFAEKVIGINADDIKEMSKESGNHIQAENQQTVQPEKEKIPFPFNHYRKEEMQNKTEQPKQKNAATVKKSVIEQIKTEQGNF